MATTSRRITDDEREHLIDALHERSEVLGEVEGVAGSPTLSSIVTRERERIGVLRDDIETAAYVSIVHETDAPKRTKGKDEDG